MVAHETFIEKFAVFDCVTITTVFVSEGEISNVITVFEVADVV